MIINIHILTLILRNDLFKKLSYTIYKILYFIDSLLNSIFKRRFLIWFNEFIQNDSYVNVKVLDQKILFFWPVMLLECCLQLLNYLVRRRFTTFFLVLLQRLRGLSAVLVNQSQHFHRVLQLRFYLFALRYTVNY